MFISIHPPSDTFAKAILGARQANAAFCKRTKGALNRYITCDLNWHARKGLFAAARKDIHQRCKDVLCPYCLDERREKDAKRIDATIRAMLTPYGATPSAITFESEAYPIDASGHCVDDVLAQWERLTARKSFKCVARDFIRGLGLAIDHEAGEVRARLNAIVFQYNPAKPSQDEWLASWNSAGHIGTATCPHWERIPPHNAEALFEAAKLVAAVGIHPRELCEATPDGFICDPRKLHAIQTALYRRRLIQTSRRMQLKQIAKTRDQLVS